MSTPRFSLSQYFLRIRAGALKLMRREPPTDELNRALADRERFFRAPPLDAELLAAVKLITPQFHLRQNEESRLLWELSQNGSSWGEYDSLGPVLEALPTPGKVLEIGPGLGRSVVFFKRKLGWEDVPFHLYEADGDKTRYTALGPRTSASFCGSIDSLRQVLEFNQVAEWEIQNAAQLDFRLDRLPGPYDLIYSFYGVGFHWSIEHFWGEIEPLMNEDTLGVFTVHHGFEPSGRLQELGCTMVPLQRILAKDRPLRILLVSRNPERLAPAKALARPTAEA
jgi:hypothetical protein